MHTQTNTQPMKTCNNTHKTHIYIQLQHMKKHIT